MQALDLASLRGEFYYHVTTTSFGPYVDQIGRHPAGGTNGWVFKVNGASPPVGADQVQLNDGDRALWYWAMFGPTGGPPTLQLTLYRPQLRPSRVRERPGHGPASSGSLAAGGRPARSNPRGPRLRRQAHRHRAGRRSPVLSARTRFC